MEKSSALVVVSIWCFWRWGRGGRGDIRISQRVKNSFYEYFRRRVLALLRILNFELRALFFVAGQHAWTCLISILSPGDSEGHSIAQFPPACGGLPFLSTDTTRHPVGDARTFGARGAGERPPPGTSRAVQAPYPSSLHLRQPHFKNDAIAGNQDIFPRSKMLTPSNDAAKNLQNASETQEKKSKAAYRHKHNLHVLISIPPYSCPFYTSPHLTPHLSFLPPQYFISHPSISHNNP